MHLPEGLENTPFTIFGLKMMVKSGLEKNIFEIATYRSHFLLINFT